MSRNLKMEVLQVNFFSNCPLKLKHVLKELFFHYALKEKRIL